MKFLRLHLLDGSSVVVNTDSVVFVTQDINAGAGSILHLDHETPTGAKAIQVAEPVSEIYSLLSHVGKRFLLLHIRETRDNMLVDPDRIVFVGFDPMRGGTAINLARETATGWFSPLAAESPDEIAALLEESKA